MGPVLIACGSLVLYFVLDISRYHVFGDSV
jgi:hypothetical protein